MMRRLFAASIVILLLLIPFINPGKIISFVSGANATLIAVAAAVSVAALSLRVLKWNVLIDNVKYRELYPVQMIGIAASNLTPGKIAEPSKALVLNSVKGIPVSQSFPTIIWERILDILVLIIISSFAAVTIGREFALLSAAGVCIFATLVLLLLAVLYKKSLAVMILKKLRLSNKVPRSFLDSFYSSKIKKSKIGKSLIITTSAWLMDGVVFYVVFLSLGQNVPAIEILSIMSISMIISVVSFLPGGLGSFEAVMTLILSTRMDASLALSGVLIARLLTFWLSIFAGGLSFAYLSKKISLKFNWFGAVQSN